MIASNEGRMIAGMFICKHHSMDATTCSLSFSSIDCETDVAVTLRLVLLLELSPVRWVTDMTPTILVRQSELDTVVNA